MSVKFVPNWRAAPRMLSQQLLLVDVSLVGVWAELPQEFKAVIEAHPPWMIAGAVGWCAVKFFARLLDQGAKTAAPEPNP